MGHHGCFDRVGSDRPVVEIVDEAPGDGWHRYWEAWLEGQQVYEMVEFL